MFKSLFSKMASIVNSRENLNIDQEIDMELKHAKGQKIKFPRASDDINQSVPVSEGASFRPDPLLELDAITKRPSDLEKERGSQDSFSSSESDPAKDPPLGYQKDLDSIYFQFYQDKLDKKTVTNLRDNPGAYFQEVAGFTPDTLMEMMEKQPYDMIYLLEVITKAATKLFSDCTDIISSASELKGERDTYRSLYMDLRDSMITTKGDPNLPTKSQLEGLISTDFPDMHRGTVETIADIFKDAQMTEKQVMSSLRAMAVAESADLKFVKGQLVDQGLKLSKTFSVTSQTCERLAQSLETKSQELVRLENDQLRQESKKDFDEKVIAKCEDVLKSTSIQQPPLPALFTVGAAQDAEDRDLYPQEKLHKLMKAYNDEYQITLYRVFGYMDMLFYSAGKMVNTPDGYITQFVGQYQGEIVTLEEYLAMVVWEPESEQEYLTLLGFFQDLLRVGVTDSSGWIDYLEVGNDIKLAKQHLYKAIGKESMSFFATAFFQEIQGHIPLLENEYKGDYTYGENKWKK